MRWPDVLINSGKSHNQVKGNPESNLWPRYPAEESLDPHQTCFSGLTTMLSWGVTCLNSFLRHWPEPRRGQSSPSHSGVSDNSFCGVPGASDSYLSLLLLILSFHSMTDCFLPLTLFFILHIFTFLTQPDGEENTARYVGGEKRGLHLGSWDPLKFISWSRHPGLCQTVSPGSFWATGPIWGLSSVLTP